MVVSIRTLGRSIGLCAAVVMIALAPAAQAGTEQQVIHNPQYKGHLLDFCASWATDCGMPAAELFCQKIGYDHASAFTKWAHPGQSTRLIGTGQVCDDENCDSFTNVTCTKTVADSGGSGGAGGGDEVTFLKPKYKGKRLDWCRTWGAECGEAAADAFCEYKGFDGATDFEEAVDIGNTKIISSGQVCADGTCDGFKKISCQ